MQQGYEIQYPVTSDGILRLMVLFVLAFAVQLVATLFFQVGPAQLAPLVLSASQDFQPLSLITHFFVVRGAISPFGFGFSDGISLLFEMLILWSFGSELDRLWGSRNFYSFFFLSQMLGGLFTVALGMALGQPFIAYGFGGGLAAMMVAYGVLWPNRQALFMFIFPLRMKWIVLILFIFLLMGRTDTLVMQLASAASGVLFLLLKARSGRLYQDSYSGNPYYSTRSSSQPASRFAAGADTEKMGMVARFKARLEEQKKKKRLDKKRKEIERRIEMKEEVDRLLEKISREGMDSLSRKEKTFLDKASKEL
ncbi:MAG: hypothetical protein CVV45_05545 [Spirochaetae bacterium HGW-Spirochaetae-10]|jgi:membrane associated rhomboid family serine protease|nr:MAG: hypothetical protein CVV45_05545 [Spirochaetae bacterium HGW-Spirochaetae-10]